MTRNYSLQIDPTDLKILVQYDEKFVVLKSIKI
jgi:hypothetical protein